MTETIPTTVVEPIKTVVPTTPVETPIPDESTTTVGSTTPVVEQLDKMFSELNEFYKLIDKPTKPPKSIPKDLIEFKYDLVNLLRNTKDSEPATKESIEESIGSVESFKKIKLVDKGKQLPTELISKIINKHIKLLTENKDNIHFVRFNHVLYIYYQSLPPDNYSPIELIYRCDMNNDAWEELFIKQDNKSINEDLKVLQDNKSKIKKSMGGNKQKKTMYKKKGHTKPRATKRNKRNLKMV